MLHFITRKRSLYYFKNKRRVCVFAFFVHKSVRSQLTEFIEVHSCNFGKNNFDLTKLICILHLNAESIFIM